MVEHDDIESTLSRLTEATAALGPRPGFAARVMDALPMASNWLDAALRSSRRVLPVAMLAAVLATVWAAQSSNSVDASLAASYGAVELDW